MSDVREIISNALARAKHDDHPNWTGFIMNQLDRAGYRILGPDEVDPVTVEQALVAVNEIAQRGYSAAYRGGAMDCDAAIRTLGRKA